MKVHLDQLIGLLFFTLLCQPVCWSQISPPGLGKVNAAEWMAVGLKQKIGTKWHLNAATYFGMGRSSLPDNYNPFKRPVLFVLNQEFSHSFKNKWTYSVAVSARIQERYNSTFPYELANPAVKKERRFYSRFTYAKALNKLKYAFTFRPEMRFFNYALVNVNLESAQLRFRFNAKAYYYLNTLKTHKLISSAEMLFASSKRINEDWGQLGYKECRFCLYYSIYIPKQKMEINFGYMNEIIDLSNVTDVNYLAFDVTIIDPFHLN
ncbi:hypothetical protein DNU06_06380 [Putridiphycobacter roseus]|uniref:DUF2490 domain-containing protein n=1 Tax=Putridiphycobacter roseus TaxID=2219161 RepID=A0A2W1N359_9FLAO|nr:DUF2490 domain-containing protein [Putridiphycobacter roseus]PZE17451.1 hypothetical protein DNU06_06380 [Putridiphycobacter roseus]